MLAMLIQREVPTGILFGSFLAISAVALATQTFNAYQNGFMYCGRTEKVYRKQNRIKFKIWFVLQTFSVLILAAFSIYAFLA